jgi:hypothetical protein
VTKIAKCARSKENDPSGCVTTITSYNAEDNDATPVKVFIYFTLFC